MLTALEMEAGGEEHDEDEPDGGQRGQDRR
jgi:hypothetical protein